MNNINWFSMALATITPLLIGFVYYHKYAFGTIWMESLSITEEKLNKVNKATALAASIASSFLLSFFLMSFCNEGIGQEGEFDNFQHGAWHGMFLAITVVTPVIIVNAIFDPKPWKSTLINILYWVITLSLMSGILDAMNHWENILLPEG